jgi:MFS family permease
MSDKQVTPPGAEPQMPSLRTTSQAETDRDAYGSSSYRWYVLSIILLIYACHSLDRGIPNIISELVKDEFALSDAQLGLFTGTFFGLAFAIAGVPMGFISDRVNRRNMLAVVVIIWSACTALGGFAPAFLFLLMSRLGVGAAEAGAAPIAIPMLSDIFEPTRRAFVLGIFYISVPAGTFLASYGGGWIAQEYGWRAALLLAGVPGLVLAILLFATVKDPKRGVFDELEPEGAVVESPDDDTSPTFREALGILFAEPGLLLLVLGCALCGFVAISTGAWMTSFFIRVHALELKDVGLILGLASMLGIAGPPTFGYLSDRAARRSPKGPLYLVSVAVVVGLAFGLFAMFVSNPSLSIGAFIIFSFLTHSYPPPLYSVLMTKTPARMRGTVMSLLQLTTNVMGFGIGASWVGFVSDGLGGGIAIREALAIAMGVLLLVAALLVIAGRLLFGAGVRRA